MNVTDARDGAQSRPGADERAAASGRRRGRHRRPSTSRSAAAWLADVPGRASSPCTTWPRVAWRAAICSGALLLLAGLVGARHGDGRRS